MNNLVAMLLYSLVARGNVLLAECSLISGNANLIALRILEQLPNEDTRMAFVQDKYMFHVYKADGITFLSVADQSFQQRLAFAFLEDTKGKFFQAYGHACNEAVAYEYNSTFGKVLEAGMKTFSNTTDADVITRVKGQLVEVKDIMVQNIENVLNRGEKIDLLVDKTAHLQDDALFFQRQARRLKRTMWWQNARMWFILAGGVALVVYFIVSLVCGFTLQHC